MQEAIGRKIRTHSFRFLSVSLVYLSKWESVAIIAKKVTVDNGIDAPNGPGSLKLH